MTQGSAPLPGFKIYSRYLQIIVREVGDILEEHNSEAQQLEVITFRQQIDTAGLHESIDAILAPQAPARCKESKIKKQSAYQKDQKQV